MSENFGTMMSGKDALEMLDRVHNMIDTQKRDIEFEELFSRMKNRFSYHIDQAEALKPVLYKARRSMYDYWKCQNCGCGITYDVSQNYCWNCGHKIKWDNPRCLTGVGDAEIEKGE